MGRAGRWLLVVLLVGELVLLSRQVARAGKEGPLIAGAAVGVLGPVAHGVSSAGRGVGSLGDAFRTRKRVIKENEELRGRLDAMQRELLRLQAIEGSALRLGNALSYQRRSNQPIKVADVVYVDEASWLRSLLVYVGEGGATVDQPVIAERGLVGRVVAAGGGYAKVQLITDRSSAVGAMIERTGRQGVVRGAGRSRLTLEYVPLQAELRPGDRLVTAGIDGIYPRGLPIGVVREVKPGTQLFHTVQVTPLVDFGALDHTFLLPAQPSARALSENLSRDLR